MDVGDTEQMHNVLQYDYTHGYMKMVFKSQLGAFAPRQSMRQRDDAQHDEKHSYVPEICSGF